MLSDAAASANQTQSLCWLFELGGSLSLPQSLEQKSLAHFEVLLTDLAGSAAFLSGLAGLETDF